MGSTINIFFLKEACKPAHTLIRNSWNLPIHFPLPHKQHFNLKLNHQTSGFVYSFYLHICGYESIMSLHKQHVSPLRVNKFKVCALKFLELISSHRNLFFSPSVTIRVTPQTVIIASNLLSLTCILSFLHRLNPFPFLITNLFMSS